MANLTWTTATSGNWGDTTKWMPSGGFPDTGDNAFITTIGSYTVTVDDTFAPENLTFDDASGILDIGSDHLFVDTSTTFAAGNITILSSRENPKICGIDDAEVVGDLITVDMPVPRHLLAQKS